MANTKNKKERTSNKREEDSLGVGKHISRRLERLLTWKILKWQKLAEKGSPTMVDFFTEASMESSQDREEDDEMIFSI